MGRRDRDDAERPTARSRFTAGRARDRAVERRRGRGVRRPGAPVAFHERYHALHVGGRLFNVLALSARAGRQAAAIIASLTAMQASMHARHASAHMAQTGLSSACIMHMSMHV
jgi:hypothetical protein